MSVSPLLDSVEIVGTDELLSDSITSPFYSFHYDENDFISLADHQAPPVEDGHVTRGGASILRNQATCPFKAFAEVRLSARTEDEPSEGISPAERGDLLHGTLEFFWTQCKSKAQLLEWIYEKDPLNEAISSASEKALALFKQHNPHISTGFLTLEKSRLDKLASTWLIEIETKRADFVVKHIEKDEQITIGNLDIKIKADRIDQLDDGRLAIIDYKSSEKTSGAWQGDRPDDPQLPLYCLKFRDDTDALLFGIVKKGASAWKGAMDEGAHLFEDKPSRSIQCVEDWPAQIKGWDETLVQLADDFYQGNAEVSPKYYSSCQYCALTPFCRRKELAL